MFISSNIQRLIIAGVTDSFTGLISANDVHSVLIVERIFHLKPRFVN